MHCWAVGEVCVHRSLERSLAGRVSLPDYAGHIAWVSRLAQAADEGDSNHSFNIAPNLLDQDFSADGRNQKWAGDISYIWTSEGWLYLAVILDLYSRRVIGWPPLIDTAYRLPGNGAVTG
jgi:transposase InsO family protein